MDDSNTVSRNRNGPLMGQSFQWCKNWFLVAVFLGCHCGLCILILVMLIIFDYNMGMQEWLSLADCASLLGKSEQTIRRWVTSGKLPSYRVGNSYVVDPADFRAYVAKSAVPEKTG